MIIKDNFLSEQQFSYIKETITAENFPWYYCYGVVEPFDLVKGEEKYNQQLTHLFYEGGLPYSEYYYKIVLPFLQLIKPLALIRCKANMLFATDSEVVHGWHRDIEKIDGIDYIGEKHKTAIYYLNTNNGKTYFKTGEIVNSVENRLVIFDGTKIHTGSSCTDEKIRIVLNFNYIEYN